MKKFGEYFDRFWGKLCKNFEDIEKFNEYYGTILRKRWKNCEANMKKFWIHFGREVLKSTIKCCQHFEVTFEKVMEKFWRKCKKILRTIWVDFKEVTEIFWRKYEEFWEHFGEGSSEEN